MGALKQERGAHRYQPKTTREPKTSSKAAGIGNFPRGTARKRGNCDKHRGPQRTGDLLECGEKRAAVGMKIIGEAPEGIRH